MKTTAIEIAGERNGMLVAVRRADQISGRRWRWLWMCDCGNEVVKNVNNVRYSKMASCGCNTRKAISESRTSHGMSVKNGSPEYGTYICWQSMHWRCSNKARKDYPSYGGRGISVCDRWSVFENFIHDMGVRPDGRSIDRKNVNGNYEPDNCRWATASEQARNRRSSRYITANGATMLLCEWSERLSMPANVFAQRVNKWGPDLAISTPYKPQNNMRMEAV